MKILLILSLCFGFTIVSCKNNENKKEQSHQFMEHLKAGDNSLEIKETCVVFIYPDSNTVNAEMEKIKKQQDEEYIAELISDEENYRALAKEFFQSKGIKIIETDTKSILFINDKGEKTKVENTLNGISTMIYMFDVTKQPLKIESLSTVSDGREFDAYFSKNQ